LQKELATQPGWPGLIERLAGSSGEAAPAKDLAQARKWFLPFSTASVELVKQLKKQNPDFAELKIYHCPMAPKPGLWMQAKGPLANPFYGSKMSRCGEEVAP
jgi:Cu(I)/Ag(I) efflux system membrane fusion protein